MSTPLKFLFSNGLVLPPSDTPSVSSLLETRHGVYTTTRTHTHNLLFWDRHLRRLSHSLHTLLRSGPDLLFGPGAPISPSLIQTLSMSVDLEQMLRRRLKFSLGKVLPAALTARDAGAGEELAITALIAGNSDRLEDIGSMDEKRVDGVFDVFVHIGMYVPPLFGLDVNGARLAVVGGKREPAKAKYSDWARQRKQLESLRPSSATELLLSDDGDRILEGMVTNFFVVCFKDDGEMKQSLVLDDGCLSSYEVHTAPVNDGVLPGVIRQLVIETCLNMGITVREVSPSWSNCETWREAFVTNSLRLVQHVEAIEAPTVWPSKQSKSWQDISWQKKQFEVTNPISSMNTHSINAFEKHTPQFEKISDLSNVFGSWKVGGKKVMEETIYNVFFTSSDFYAREILKKAVSEGYPLNVISS